MDIYKLLFILFLSFFIYEYLRHGLTKNILKYTVALIILIFLLMIISNYMDISSIFAKDSPLTTTGAAIVTGAKDTMDKIDFQEILTKAGDFFSDAANKLSEAINKKW